MAGLSIRPHVLELPLVESGGTATTELARRGFDQPIRLNTNEGPFQPFPQALAAIERAARELNRYPEPAADALTQQLAAHFRVAPGEVIVDAGSSPLLYLLANALLEPGDEIVYPWPSFPIYIAAAKRVLATPVRVPLRDYHLDMEGLLAAVTPRTRMVMVCNPNNPTGTIVGRAELDRLLAALPPGVLAVLDEAYAEFADDFADGFGYVREGRPVFVLRTFSKVYGLAGARVGYGVGPRELVDGLRRLQAPYAVNRLALVAAQESLPLQEEVAARVRLIREGREQLSAGFRRLGLEYVRSDANFLLVDVGRDGLEVSRRLMERGILVRPGRGYDCPRHVRVTVGLPEENAQFLDALEQVLAE